MCHLWHCFGHPKCAITGSKTLPMAYDPLYQCTAECQTTNHSVQNLKSFYSPVVPDLYVYEVYVRSCRGGYCDWDRTGCTLSGDLWPRWGISE